MKDKIKIQAKEKKIKEQEKIEKWSLKGSKKIMWDRITELELRIKELEEK